jgi:hypothetical protein
MTTSVIRTVLGGANHRRHLVPWQVPVAANGGVVVNVISGFMGVEEELPSIEKSVPPFDFGL